jgi:hypothetical protein
MEIQIDTVILISTLANCYGLLKKLEIRIKDGQKEIFLQTADIDASETKYWDDDGGYDR